jgi:RNA polymerase sigma-70 factor (ECF subfamily)
MLNLHRDQLRSPHARARFEVVEDAGLAAHDVQAGRTALRETARHMVRLPLEQRQVLLLIAVEGFGYAEACKILGIPKGTLMSRLARGRAALRAMRSEEPEPMRLRSVK